MAASAVSAGSTTEARSQPCEYVYNNRTDVLWFLALSRKVNKGTVCKSKLIEVYYSNKECYSEFCIEIL